MLLLTEEAYQASQHQAKRLWIMYAAYANPRMGRNCILGMPGARPERNLLVNDASFRFSQHRAVLILRMNAHYVGTYIM